MEHEAKVNELTELQAKKNAEHEEELKSLRRELEEYTNKNVEAADLRQKLEESQTLHSSTLERLNKIHDDKLQSLELELQEAKQHHFGAEETRGNYQQELEKLKQEHQSEIEKVRREHSVELGELKKSFEQKIEEAKSLAEVNATTTFYAMTLRVSCD